MILSQNHKKPTQARSERWLMGGLLCLLLLGLGYILWQYQGNVIGEPIEGVIFCDAENVKGDHFVNGNLKFGKGDYQSDEVARSGRYACEVPAGEGAQYGFSYKLQAARVGEVYRVTVWRYKNILNEGKLAINGSGAAGFYHETAEVMQRENGWEQLAITFHIPYRSDLDWINVYVYTGGYEAVFFDDLQIERIDFWEEQEFQPRQLALEIDAGALQKLETKRREAIQSGILFADSEDWVKGQIKSPQVDPIAVRLRLKGDWLDHLADDKWSFRVKVRDPDHWQHFKLFSLHTPAARYHLHEWVLHRLWEQEDILTTRYDLVELKINDDSKGIYAYEEHFAKQLVESRQRREGPILKLNEDGLWLAHHRALSEHGFIAGGTHHSAAEWQNADIAAFGEDELLQDTTLKLMLEQGKRLLTDYLSGKRAVGSVFDVDRLAAYYAICDVLNAYHGIVWHNQRFYYNPVTDRLEPIGFDGFGGPPEETYTFLGEGALNPRSLMSDNLFHRLFQDTAFTARYVQRLYQYTNPAFFNTFLDSLQVDWTARKQWLQMEFPGYQTKLEDFRTRARYVRSLILPYNQQSLKASRMAGKPERIVVRNTHTLPIEIVGWSTTATANRQTLEEIKTLPAQIPRTFLSRLRADSLVDNFANFRFLEEVAMGSQGPPTTDTLNLPERANYLYYRPLGLDSIFYTRLGPEIPSSEPRIVSSFEGDELESRPFFSVQDRRVIFHLGQHEIQRSIYIPAGYKVEIPAGTALDLLAGAVFVSRSPVHLLGESENPVRIYSSDGKGGGFTVLNAPSTSILKNVDFSGLNTLKVGGWQLTGAVNFHESAVRLYRCRFANNHCEDALNIIRSEFQLDACRFDQIYSDAFDSDFSKGEIRNCAFLRTGNDGLDVSGSIVNVYDCEFDTNGDKGISVGEESDVHVFNTSIRNAPIAMASKDNSMLYVRNVSLEDCEQGFVAFQKKPEFGGATILVESHKAEGVRRLFVEGEGSRVQIGLVE